jgi:hypothetical protein
MPDFGHVEIRHQIFVIETNHFINTGFGWVCKHCDAEDEARGNRGGSGGGDDGASEGRARFFIEGEAEATEPRLSTVALARWRDATRRSLVCPRCSIEETIDKA